MSSIGHERDEAPKRTAELARELIPEQLSDDEDEAFAAALAS